MNFVRVLCVALVCVLLMGCFLRPVAVNAVLVDAPIYVGIGTAAGVTISAPVAIAAILVCAGLVAYNLYDFEDLVYGIENKLVSSGRYDSDIPTASFEDKYYVPETFVNDVLDTVFDPIDGFVYMAPYLFFDSVEYKQILPQIQASSIVDYVNSAKDCLLVRNTSNPDEYLYLFCSDFSFVDENTCYFSPPFAAAGFYAADGSDQLVSWGTNSTPDDISSLNLSEWISSFSWLGWSSISVEASSVDLCSDYDLDFNNTARDLDDEQIKTWSPITVSPGVVSDGDITSENLVSYYPVTIQPDIVQIGEMAQEVAQSGVDSVAGDNVTIIPDVSYTVVKPGTNTGTDTGTDVVNPGTNTGTGTGTGTGTDVNTGTGTGTGTDVNTGTNTGTGTVTGEITDFGSASNLLSLKFAWIDQFFDFLRELFDRISSQDEPPKIMLNLSRAEGSYDLGEDTVMVDFTWYSRYKPTVDLFLSGLIWIVFAWNIYKKLPSILSGLEMSQDGGTSISGYYGDPNQLRLPGSKGRRKP